MLQEVIRFPQRQPVQLPSRVRGEQKAIQTHLIQCLLRAAGKQAEAHQAVMLVCAPVPVGSLESVAIRLEDGRRNSGAAFRAPPICNNRLTAVRSRALSN